MRAVVVPLSRENCRGESEAFARLFTPTVRCQVASDRMKRADLAHQAVILSKKPAVAEVLEATVRGSQPRLKVGPAEYNPYGLKI